MKLVSGIVDSGFFAQSALSAEVATKDSLGRNISETYLTGVDLTPYQTTAGMTAYQSAGDYYSASNPSGFLVADDITGKLDASAYATDSGSFLTAVPAGYATENWVTSQGYLTGETDWTDTITAASANAYEQATAAIPAPFDPSYISAQVDNKLNSAIYAADSGSFITAHQSLPQSANWNSTYNTVRDNSGSWTGGGGGADYTAGAGIDITNDVISVTGKEDTITYGYSGDVISSLNGHAILSDPIPYEVYGISASANISAYESDSALWISGRDWTPELNDKLDSTAQVVTSTAGDGTYVTAINGMGISGQGGGGGGGSYTGDAQGALDEVYSNSATWNSTYNTVSTNSASWTGGTVTLNTGTGRYMAGQGSVNTVTGFSGINGEPVVLGTGTVVGGSTNSIIQLGNNNRIVYPTSQDSDQNYKWSTGSIILISGAQGYGYYKGHQLWLCRGSAASSHRISFDVNNTAADVVVYQSGHSAVFTPTGFSIWGPTTAATARRNIDSAVYDSWNSTYNAVSDNSANWNSAYDQLGNVTALLNSL